MNSIERYMKKEKPFLIIEPKFDLGDNTMFGDQLPYWVESATYLFQELEMYGFPILDDTKNKLKIYNIPSRVKINFELTFLCDSLMEQVNLGMYLKSSVAHKRPFYLRNQPVEGIIPKKFIQLLGAINGINLGSKLGDELFKKYLNQHGRRSIKEKITPSSGRPNYYYENYSNLLCNFEDNPSIDDGETNGQNKNNFRVTDNLSVELWVPLNYILVGEARFYNDANIIMQNDNEDEIEDKADGVYFASAFNFDISPDRLKDGKEKIDNITYIIDDDSGFNKQGMDVVDFRDIIPLRYRGVIHYIRKHNLEYEKYFELRVYGSTEDQRLDKFQVMIDWDNFKMYNKYPKIGGKYSVAFYVNMELCNDLIGRINKKLFSYNDLVINEDSIKRELDRKIHDLPEAIEEAVDPIHGNKHLKDLTEEKHDEIVMANTYKKK